MGNRKQKRLALVFLVLVCVALYYQNCAPGFKTTDLETASLGSTTLVPSADTTPLDPQPNDPIADEPVTPSPPTTLPPTPVQPPPVPEAAPFALNENDIKSVYRGNLVKIVLSAKDLTKSSSITVQSVDKSAKSGVDFVVVNKVVTLSGQSPTQTIELQTLVPDPIAPSRELIVRFSYTDSKGATQNYDRSIQIKSRLVPAKYKSIKAGYGMMFGLGLDGVTWIWGYGGSKDPSRVIPVAGTTIDFESIQSESGACFNVNPTRDVYCINYYDFNGSNAIGKVGEGDIKLTPRQKRLENTNEWDLRLGFSLYSLDSSGSLYYTDLRSNPAMTKAIASSNKYKKIVIDGEFTFVGLTTTNQIHMRVIADNGETPGGALYSPPSEIQKLGIYSILADGSVVKGEPFGEKYTLFALPEKPVGLLGDRCFLSAGKNIYCGSTGKVRYNLDQEGLEKISMYFPDETECGLKADGSLSCRGYPHSPAIYGYFSGNALPIYQDINADWVSQHLAGLSSRDPLKTGAQGSTTPSCTMDSSSTVTCGGRKIFGNLPIKAGSLRAYDSGPLHLNQSFYTVETASGRTLGHGIYKFSDGFAPVYKMVDDPAAALP